nr:aldehyde dehydrogenase family protein [Acidobacteriota bacterium]
MRNYIDGQWRDSAATETLVVLNPASGEELARTPLSPAAEVDQAAQAGARAFREWRRVPVTERVQFLFRLKALMEEHLDDLARTITMECGKTLAESRGELRRAIENVEVACGTPSLIQGYNSEDIASGIDEMMIRQPLGVCAIIAPFNFPGMIPFWFLPYAIACGNTVVLKPSERVPLTMQKVFRLLEVLSLPAGVVNLVNGGRDAVNAILDHPTIRSVSFVGSSSTARHVYSRGAAAGKRMQCQGGAKNPVIVMPDADMTSASEIIADSAFGCAGQRCLASSLAVTVGDALGPFSDAIRQRAESRTTGSGLEDGVQMGPVISAESRARIEQLIGQAVKDGARPLVDGRNPDIPGYRKGHFVKPTVLH